MFGLADKIRQRKGGVASSESDAAQSASVRSATIRDRLLLQELQELRANMSPQCTLHHPDPNKLHEFTLTVKPKEGFWADGTFRFEIAVPEGYNHIPPVVHCVTRIWHPNIDEEGRLCLSLLRLSSLDSSGWAPTRRLLDVIWGIESLFTDLCDFNDALNTEVAQQYQNDPEVFRRTARQYVYNFARSVMLLAGNARVANFCWPMTTVRLFLSAASGGGAKQPVTTKAPTSAPKSTPKKQPVYQVPEYYSHTTYCFYDSELRLRPNRLPQPSPKKH